MWTKLLELTKNQQIDLQTKHREMKNSSILGIVKLYLGKLIIIILIKLIEVKIGTIEIRIFEKDLTSKKDETSSKRQVKRSFILNRQIPKKKKFPQIQLSNKKLFLHLAIHDFGIQVNFTTTEWLIIRLKIRELHLKASKHSRNTHLVAKS